MDTRMLRRKNPWGLSVPLNILVANGSARKSTVGLKCHSATLEFPYCSFIRVEPGLVVCSPELCFMQMASELSFVELVTLAYELCGSYRLGNKSDPDRGFRDDLPLTSTARLIEYATKAIGQKGRVKALRALAYTADNSASPMETILTLLLALPCKQGGYGFSLPRLNYPLDVPRKTKSSGDKPRYYCDLYWPDSKLAIEYDSDAYHAASDRIARDAIRRNALSLAGATVITVSRRQIQSTTEIHKIAVLLSKHQNRRLRLPLTEFTGRRATLRKQLLSQSLLKY